LACHLGWRRRIDEWIVDYDWRDWAIGPGTFSGGGFAVKSGFWNVSASVPMVGAPELTITLISPNSVVVS
jgi:hypothetical protein